MPLTIEQPSIARNGRLAAVRNRNGKCSIVWRFRSREIWVAERPEAGPKRALYEFLKAVPRGVERHILRLEADADHVVAREMADAIRQFDLDERALEEDFVMSHPVVIESDPWVLG
jgi:hypothetical protein